MYTIVPTFIRLYTYESAGVPGVNNDGVDTANIGRIFDVGDVWVDTLTDDSYICADNATGAAIWNQTNSAGGASPYTEIADGINVKTLMEGVTGSFRIADSATATITANTIMTAQQTWVGVNRETSKLHLNVSTITMFAGSEFSNMTIQITGGTLVAKSILMHLKNKCKLDNIIFEFITANPTNMIYCTGTLFANVNNVQITNIDIIFYSATANKMGFMYCLSGAGLYPRSWTIEKIVVDTKGGNITYTGVDNYFMYMYRTDYISVKNIKVLSNLKIFRGAGNVFDGAIYVTGANIINDQTQKSNWDDLMGIDLCFHRVFDINITNINATNKVCLDTRSGTNLPNVLVNGMITNYFVLGNGNLVRSTINNFAIASGITINIGGAAFPACFLNNGIIACAFTLNENYLHWQGVNFIGTVTTTNTMDNNKFTDCYWQNAFNVLSGTDQNTFVNCRFNALMVGGAKNTFTGGSELVGVVSVTGNDNIINGNHFTSYGTCTGSRNQIKDNNVYGLNGANSILLSGTADYNDVSGNICQGAVADTSGSANNVIIPNIEY